MLLHPLSKHKRSFWELVKSLFSAKTPEQVPVIDQGHKLAKEPENLNRKATVFPGSGDF
ncbi:hypothetical protein M2375_001567 [Comamonas sp. BIGb0152]|uniref:hypothetical protein n=1 Tax=Comamonas sp. BIGb0152 TaxID=2940601 RepID=UPI002168EF95|nr:hypothetical protein [Comamonas sp. BIGb0152]MCS4293350.1 hypothetical protein [Comamonas sp. BIGb0152]